MELNSLPGSSMVLRKIKAVIQIFRPELPFAAGVCVLLGEMIALGGFPSPRQAILGFVSVFFISGSALVLNDYFDLEVDKVNMPQRPLPLGILSPKDAVLITIIAIAIGLFASLLISGAAFLFCLLACVIGILYNWKYKEAGLLGNLMVSFSVAFTFLFGGITVGELWNKIVWIFGLIAFFIDFGEEIAGDAMDMEGDKKRGSRSIAIRFGRSFALLISATSFGIVVILSWIPFVLKWLGVSYLIMMVIMDSIIVFFTIQLLRSETSTDGRRSMRSIYMGALVGMLAFIIARLLQ